MKPLLAFAMALTLNSAAILTYASPDLQNGWALVEAAGSTGQIPAVAPRLAEDVGLKTVGFTPLSRKEATLPAEFADDFSTAEDNQTQVEIRVFATGQDGFPRELGAFLIQRIEPAPRAIPRIRIVIRVDESGSVEISARHLRTGRTQRAQLGRGTTSEE